MFKKMVFFSLALIAQSLFAANKLELYQAPLSSISKFRLVQASTDATNVMAVTAVASNTLQQLGETVVDGKTIIRYQQLYQGIPVVGAQVMISHAQGNEEINGRLFDDIDLYIRPVVSEKKALELAKKSYFSINPSINTTDAVSELQIRQDQGGELKLIYLSSFRGIKSDNKPVWPFFVIDANTGAVIKQWDNITNYLDSGPGGNEKVHEYWYGKDGLPALDVKQDGLWCVMETPSVKLVDVGSFWDWSDAISTPFQYLCDHNTGANINGAFSPGNDAYYFGQVIVDMYQQWYGVKALQTQDGQSMQLVVRVHFGESFDNAFWNGKTMSFGDGNTFFPLVSLDVVGHEVTHGFTQQHSGLEYHDQSGALNESVSDMAGQASRAYLLETTTLLYKRAYTSSEEMTWGVGETIVRDSLRKALRFMDVPSSDGDSADCLDKNLAQSNGAYCAISYDELLVHAQERSDPQKRQSFIVHKASGIFNKAFYLLSKNMGIKTAYHVMLTANAKYWTPTTEFKDAACGILYAAKDLSLDTDKVQSVFGQVGVDTRACQL
ncbi:MAG: M4 family metallopeptidase [Legionellales bacterium]